MTQRDIKFAEDILTAAWKRTEKETQERDLRKKRQQEAFNAGVPGIRDPEFWRALDDTTIDNAFARMLGILPPAGRVGIRTKPVAEDELESGKIDSLYSPKDEGREVCGYCGRQKKVGQWCDYYRCQSNQKRRGEI